MAAAASKRRQGTHSPATNESRGRISREAAEDRLCAKIQVSDPIATWHPTGANVVHAGVPEMRAGDSNHDLVGVMIDHHVELGYRALSGELRI